MASTQLALTSGIYPLDTADAWRLIAALQEIDQRPARRLAHALEKQLSYETIGLIGLGRKDYNLVLYALDELLGTAPLTDGLNGLRDRLIKELTS